MNKDRKNEIVVYLITICVFASVFSIGMFIPTFSYTYSNLLSFRIISMILALASVGAIVICEVILIEWKSKKEKEEQEEVLD